MPLVLIADDDYGVRQMLQESLEAAGLETLTATDGRDALAKHRSHRPDVLITDVLMPKLSGIELVNRLLTEAPGTKIIVISGVVGGEFLEAGRDIGVCRVFEKPFDPRAIVAAVRQLLPAG